MPIRTSVLERLFLLRLNRGPGPVLDLFGAGSFHTAVLAADAGVFDALREDPRSVDAIAADLGADPEALAALLDYLTTVGYVAEDDGDYRLSAMSREWFAPDARRDVTPWLRFWRELVFPYWAEHFESVLREGEPPETIYEWLDDQPGGWELAQRGFAATAAVTLDPVLELASVPGDAGRLLDVGGGHGRYAVAFCREFGLSATLLDDPGALDVARETVADAGLADRIELRGGDYLTDDLGSGYDVVLLFNVLHAHDAAEARVLLEKVSSAMAPGGRLFVLDQFQGGRTSLARTNTRFLALAYLTMLGGTVHAYEDVAGWLRGAGLVDVTKHTSLSLPGTPLVEARRP